MLAHRSLYIFFLNAPATTEIYTLSLHDALPISENSCGKLFICAALRPTCSNSAAVLDRKSTRLNSSHGSISYAVFCLKKKIKEAININIGCLTGDLFECV